MNYIKIFIIFFFITSCNSISPGINIDPSKYGFEPVKLTEYSVREQISLFNNVEYVIAPHGAGLTNLVFCNEKANVIELLQDNYLNWCFKFLCQGKGLRYTGLINSTKVLSQDKHKDEIEIDLELLEKSISE